MADSSGPAQPAAALSGGRIVKPLGVALSMTIHDQPFARLLGNGEQVSEVDDVRGQDVDRVRCETGDKSTKLVLSVTSPNYQAALIRFTDPVASLPALNNTSSNSIMRGIE